MPPCVDNATFIDKYGNSCAKWVSLVATYPCNTDARAHCPNACRACPGVHVPASAAREALLGFERSLITIADYLRLDNALLNETSGNYARKCCTGEGWKSDTLCFSSALQDDCLALRPCFNASSGGCAARTSTGNWSAGSYAYCNEEVAAISTRHRDELNALKRATGVNNWKEQGIDKNPCDVCFPPKFDWMANPQESSTCTTVAPRQGDAPPETSYVPRICMTLAPGMSESRFTGLHLSSFNKNLPDWSLRNAKEYIQQSKSFYLAGFTDRAPFLPTEVSEDYPMRYTLFPGRFDKMLSSGRYSKSTTDMLYYFQFQTALKLKAVVQRSMVNKTAAWVS